jgi:hypothetical protein
MPFGKGVAPENRTVNGFFCAGCNSLLLSLFTHDYKVCECGNMVDGGNDYVRRGYQDPEAFAKVVEIYDWGPLLALAELGGAMHFGNSDCKEFTEIIEGYVKDERLIPVNDDYLEEVDENDGVVGLPDEAELAAQEAAKQDRDRQVAEELFTGFSLGLGDD